MPGHPPQTVQRTGDQVLQLRWNVPNARTPWLEGWYDQYFSGLRFGRLAEHDGRRA